MEGYKQEIQEILGEIQEVTARLGVATDEPSSDTQALATTGRNLKAYKKSLVKAKDDQLPKLFRKMRDIHEQLDSWMKAELIPLKADSSDLNRHIKSIERRIDSVELYAGLTEDVVQIRKGKPASKDTKLHLMQRMHFMDEECLVNYAAGGMSFDNIKAFDRWLAKKANRDRILPFPRCCVAFRVRRHRKQARIENWQQFIGFFFRYMDADADKFTFLYIRNGTQLFRLATSMEFRDKLFPDTERSVFGAEEIWADHRGSHFMVKSRRELDAMDKEYKEVTLPEWKADCEKHKQQYRDELAAWKRKKDKEQWDHEPSLYKPWKPRKPSDGYEKYDPSNIYYDDISKFLDGEMSHYNKIGLLLQGLFDRSMVLHPHAKAKLWTAEGFNEMIELIFDKDRALVAGEKPDFEAYRKRLNKTLKRGSMVSGQKELWLQMMAEKYTEYATHYRPDGNPGPPTVTRITRLSRDGKAHFSWLRERTWQGEESWKTRHGYHRWANVEVPGVKTHFSCPAELLFNVDAYTPGDFKQFYKDPRTRAEYLKWAPLMLAAEDYHANKGQDDE